MLRYYMCLRIQHTSKECCVHSFKAKLVQSTTASIYYKEIVQSLKRMPHHFMQCVRYSTLSKEYCIPLGTFVTVTGKTLSKYCCIYWAFCYKEMLHVLKEIPHHSPQGVQKCFPGTCIYILCLNMSNLDRNVYVRIQGSKIPRFAQKLLEIDNRAGKRCNS